MEKRPIHVRNVAKPLVLHFTSHTWKSYTGGETLSMKTMWKSPEISSNLSNMWKDSPEEKACEGKKRGKAFRCLRNLQIMNINPTGKKPCGRERTQWSIKYPSDLQSMKEISLERGPLNVNNVLKRSHPVPYKHKKELTGEKPSDYEAKLSFIT